MIVGIACLIIGFAHEAMIAELPLGNPPPALLAYYERQHRIATATSSAGGALILMAVIWAVWRRFGQGSKPTK